ncbi:DDB1CUL4-associated and CUL4-associated factor 8-like isoform X1 [Octopus vulgaris]|uniref:DDB1CUL4-associated and CUL4-associated factor 8-like isoform X1 n=2 Tax=Octopus TaxID=6643 RepID=A0AA36AVH6_OCTVU|nr:DDB1- and CUL4-associated factor 8 [Octopus sinensis]CAI9723048.1 DDB1CUL4-associated and CUL4-associated factor 8-like isoform X1 [Octopus vulgaris]
MAESSLIISSSDCDVDNKKSNNHFSNDDKFHDSSQTTPDNHVAEKTQDYTSKDNASSSKIPTHLAIMEENNSHEPDLSLPSLKKDDSGVDFEKSPASTSAQEGPILSDCSESVSESLTDSAACSYTNSVGDIKCDGKSKTSVSDEEDLPSLDVQDSELNDKEDSCKLPCNAEKMDLDSVNTEDINSESVEKEKLKPKLHSSVNSDDGGKAEMDYEHLDDNVEDDDDKNEETGSKKLSSSSSSSSSSSEEDEEEDIDDEEDEDEDESDMDYDSDKIPKHSWKAIYDLRSREFGHSTKTPPSIFREKVNSSLQMVQRLTLQYKMEYHNGCVNALNFNRIGTLLASGSDDLNIVLWNWVQSRPALVFDSGHRSNIFQAKFMPFSGDCHVVSCARDGQVRLAELSLTGVCKGTKKLAVHRGAAHKLALELDSPHVFLSCGEDALTYEIDLRQEKPNKLVTVKEFDKKVPLYSIHSNPVNSFEFCVGGKDYYLRIYDKRKIADSVNDGVLKKFCPQHLIDSSIKANATCACYNYNGTEVLGTYNDEDIYLFNNLDSDGADYIHHYKGHRNNATVKGVNFYGPKSEYIVSGSDCGHIFLWDKQTESVVQFMKGDDGGVINVLEPHPFAPFLATSGLDSDVKIWAPTAEEPTKLKGLKKIMKMNHKQREKERAQEPEIDNHMLLFLMNLHSRRFHREEDDGNSSDDSDLLSDDEEPERIQCTQS